MTNQKHQRLPVKNTSSGKALTMLLDNPEGLFIVESDHSRQFEDQLLGLSTYFDLPVSSEFIGMGEKRYYLDWDLLDYEIKERIGSFKNSNLRGVRNEQ